MQTGYYFLDDEGFMTRVLTLIVEDTHLTPNNTFYIITEFLGVERENAYDEPGFYKTTVYDADRHPCYSLKYPDLKAARKGHAVILIKLRADELFPKL